jgi:hypothetical protein
VTSPTSKIDEQLIPIQASEYGERKVWICATPTLPAVTTSVKAVPVDSIDMILESQFPSFTIDEEAAKEIAAVITAILQEIADTKGPLVDRIRETVDTEVAQQIIDSSFFKDNPAASLEEARETIIIHLINDSLEEASGKAEKAGRTVILLNDLDSDDDAEE